MPDNHYKKALIGVEDICFDTDRNNATFSRVNSTGASQEITKLSARHIPVSNFLSTAGVESVEDFIGKILLHLEHLDGFHVAAVTSDSAFNIPGKEDRKNLYLAFDSNGNLFLTVPEGVDPPDGPVDPETYLTVIKDIKVIAESSYTFIESDTGKMLVFTSAFDVTVFSAQNLSEGWQVTIIKASTGNSITHLTAGGAQHTPNQPIVVSADYAIYSSIVWNNTGVAAKYKFTGEIDGVSQGGDELFSRTITIPAGTTGPQAQVIIDAIGKNLHRGVLITIEFDNQTMQVTEALRFDGFYGAGGLNLIPSVGYPFDHSAKTVIIENINNAPAIDFAHDFLNIYGHWDFRASQAAVAFVSNTCALIEISGIAFKAKANAVVWTANSSHCKSSWCSSHIVGGDAAIVSTCCFLINTSNVDAIATVFETDIASTAIEVNSGTINVNYSGGNGTTLVSMVRGSMANQDFPTVNATFTFTAPKIYEGYGVWISGTIVGNV
jgi:hypothetical protein